jgi:hypothetical protein
MVILILIHLNQNIPRSKGSEGSARQFFRISDNMGKFFIGLIEAI